MKDFLEKLLDFIYDYIDYIIMLIIVIVVVAIIGWRLEIIFTGDDGTSSDPPTEVIDGDENESKNDEEDQLDEQEEPEEPEESDESEETEEPEETEDGTDIVIEIPSGTMPPGIADILVENNLIDDGDEFLSEVQEENLETGLKAGEYVIPTGSSIDEILEILTK